MGKNIHLLQEKYAAGILLLILVITLTILSSCRAGLRTEEIAGHVIWYDTPARDWDHALPLGNGRIGVMVFGDTNVERIQLNDDSMWPADLGWDEPEGNSQDLEYIRTLLMEGKNREADSLFVEKFSHKSIVRSHQTLGDLHIELGHQGVTDYRRELNISDAVFTASYRVNGNLFTEKVFVSHPHQAIVIELSTEDEDGMSGKIRLSRPDDNGIPTAETTITAEGRMAMRGMVTQQNGKFNSNAFPITKGVEFETLADIDHEGGNIIPGGEFLEMQNVKRAVIVLVSNSSYYHPDYSEQNRRDLTALTGLSFSDLEKAHIEDHHALFRRIELKLADRSPDTLPTDRRLLRVREGKHDPELEVLLFHYGRYLLIASSRPGTNPANLQGLWNPYIEAPWNADYHLNINLQMNYWLANPTAMDELNLPLFEYIDRLIENGRVTARQNYGCRGAFIPHASDLWAPTWLRAPTAYWGCSVGAGGWLIQHYWQHFLFTSDTAFLRNRAYPALSEVAQFYSDWLVTDHRDGMLVSSPSTSPENRFFNEKVEAVATCMGSAIDQQIIAEVFDNYLTASEILGVAGEQVRVIQQQRQKLRPGFILGSDGRILEWDREYAEPEPGHRHMSHLYGFHPGTAVSKDETPVIFEAVRKTLDHRLANGGAGTGWSRAWLINCSARLLDSAMIGDHIQHFLQRSFQDNLFDSHPPFQIDGNFGYTAGIAESLMQSHEDVILRILPALPYTWYKGEVKGLKARGNIRVDITWDDHRPAKVIIRSESNCRFKMLYEDVSIPVDLGKGETFEYNFGMK